MKFIGDIEITLRHLLTDVEVEADTRAEAEQLMIQIAEQSDAADRGTWDYEVCCEQADEEEAIDE